MYKFQGNLKIIMLNRKANYRMIGIVYYNRAMIKINILHIDYRYMHVCSDLNETITWSRACLVVK